MEDDARELARRCTKTYFYPRPPDGGRPDYATLTSQTEYISIHALRVEGDCTLWTCQPVQLQISIHALRMEGDGFRDGSVWSNYKFLSTPSGWRATRFSSRFSGSGKNFYPRPPGGGRPRTAALSACNGCYFYPRPPGGGRLCLRLNSSCAFPFLSTPSGWRATKAHGFRIAQSIFLSTPSGWRATVVHVTYLLRNRRFLSTPSGWRATSDEVAEGIKKAVFLSTPSGWRATGGILSQGSAIVGISIHALRVEGD